MTDILSILFYAYLCIGALAALYSLAVNAKMIKYLPITGREIWLDCIYCVLAWPHLLYTWMTQP